MCVFELFTAAADYIVRVSTRPWAILGVIVLLVYRWLLPPCFFKRLLAGCLRFEVLTTVVLRYAHNALCRGTVR